MSGNDYRHNMLELKGVLTAATTERPKRATFAGDELGWVLYERDAMHDAVNRLRARYGKPPVERAELVRAENRAVGHVDYVSKFALAAADLVHA